MLVIFASRITVTLGGFFFFFFFGGGGGGEGEYNCVRGGGIVSQHYPSFRVVSIECRK